MPFIKGLEMLKIIDFNDRNTVVVTFKYPFIDKEEILFKIQTFKTSIAQFSEKSFLMVYFCGDAWLESEKLWTNIGTDHSNPFCIEDGVSNLCKVSNNLAIWAIFNCSR